MSNRTRMLATSARSAVLAIAAARVDDVEQAGR
jgi:hypothetical protein